MPQTIQSCPHEDSDRELGEFRDRLVKVQGIVGGPLIASVREIKP